MSNALWQTWHDKGRQPEHLGPLLQAYQPLFDREVDRWSGSGLPRVALESHARQLAIGAFENFNPKLAQLQTHVMSRLRGMDNFVRSNQLEVRMPTARARLAEKVYRASQQLELELGREPTDDEIARKTGVGTTTLGKLARFQSQLSSRSEAGGFSQPAKDDISHDQIVASFLHSDLSPMQQKVFEHSIGFNGKPALGPGAIATKLGVSGARVSQLKNEIAAKATRYQQATNFLMS